MCPSAVVHSPHRPRHHREFFRDQDRRGFVVDDKGTGLGVKAFTVDCELAPPDVVAVAGGAMEVVCATLAPSLQNPRKAPPRSQGL
jgi:hypothetical protein